uniref:DNA-directed RNA polymerase subunit n=1 Tax=Astrosyne radiata TaxID=1158023 RepID=A0A2U9NTG1_9STRA|nr:RNA polymerase beta [Astrosyne radiata]AWT40312.1 RNA polymerase beta [Astrosyne radiata]
MRKMSRERIDYVKIKLASPEQILSWSRRKLPNGIFIGEVTTADTLNYKTLRPEPYGLFCEKIFGPIIPYKCSCRKYDHEHYAGFVCEVCHVEISGQNLRRYRMGYLKLVHPVVHIWYMCSRPNYISILLEIEDFEKTFNTTYNILSKGCNSCTRLVKNPAILTHMWDERIKRIKLASLIYFVGNDQLAFYGLHWDLQKYRQARNKGLTMYGLKPGKKPPRGSHVPDYLIDLTPYNLLGASLLKKELNLINVSVEIIRIRTFIIMCNKMMNKENLEYHKFQWFRKWEKRRVNKILLNCIKRLRILENLHGTGTNPAWIILTYLPVIPPHLRPILHLESGRYAVADLNELYRRVMVRNTRVDDLSKFDAPALVVQNEKRMLQEAVDALFDNGRRGIFDVGPNELPLRSLSHILKGKYGRFRLNLLGKRVDYSGRSVIVVGPNLKINQCGLPYEMAKELFLPFITEKLISLGLAQNNPHARAIVYTEKFKKIIYPMVKEIVQTHPVFLNRAPTLHKFGVQAFEAVLTHDNAIKLHPLVCTGFNADFDGDQMAIHIPMSLDAQAECYLLMLSPANFLSPANSKPMIIPTQDMVLGCYYLTVPNIAHLLGSGHYFSDLKDVLLAYSQDKLEIHSNIWVRYPIENLSIKSLNLLNTHQLKDKSVIEYYDKIQIRKAKNGTPLVQYIQTTTGRVILNYTMQKILKLF